MTVGATILIAAATTTVHLADTTTTEAGPITPALPEDTPRPTILLDTVGGTNWPAPPICPVRVTQASMSVVPTTGAVARRIVAAAQVMEVIPTTVVAVHTTVVAVPFPIAEAAAIEPLRLRRLFGTLRQATMNASVKLVMKRPVVPAIPSCRDSVLLLPVSKRSGLLPGHFPR